jgi:hypothetical protein
LVTIPGVSSPIVADGVSITTLTIKAADINNNLVTNSTYSVFFVKDIGDGDFVGDYQILNNSPYVRTNQGVANLWIKSPVKSGKTIIKVLAEGLDYGTGEITFVSSTAAKIVLTTNMSGNKTGLGSISIMAEIRDSNNNLVETASNTVVFSVYYGNRLRTDVPATSITVINGKTDWIYSDNTAGIMTIVCRSTGLVEGRIDITNSIGKGIAGYYLFSDPDTDIYMPAWAVDNDVTISLTTGAAVSLTGVNTAGVSILYNTIKQYDMTDESGVAIHSLNRNITIRISYLDANDDGVEDITNTKVENLKMYVVNVPLGGNPVGLVWIRYSRVDKQNKCVYADVDHLSVFMLGSFSDTENLLYQNYPNPFQPSRDVNTRIEYSVSSVIPTSSEIQCSLKVYNIAGELVRTLVNSTVLSGSKGYVDWDGKNDSGDLVTDGVYLCQLIVSDYKKIIKILLIK